MTFAHPHFIRGDKQRCLLMRSIVKKPVLLRQLASDGISSTAHVPPRFHPATINNSLVQHHHPLGLNTLGHQQQSYGMINMAHQQVANLPALSPLLAQLNQGQGLYPANGFIRRGGNDGTTITPPPSSYWAPSSLQLHSTVPNPFSATSSAPVAFKPTMQNDLETLHRQRQQELLPQILSGIHDGTRIGSYNQALLSSIQPAAAAAAVGYHHGIDTVGRLASTTPGSFNVAVVTLASQMMKSDPSMEPWRAIELAKMCLPEPGTFGSLP